jgi:hypothetical protein
LPKNERDDSLPLPTDGKSPDDGGDDCTDETAAAPVVTEAVLALADGAGGAGVDGAGNEIDAECADADAAAAAAEAGASTSSTAK